MSDNSSIDNSVSVSSNSSSDEDKDEDSGKQIRMKNSPLKLQSCLGEALNTVVLEENSSARSPVTSSNLKGYSEEKSVSGNSTDAKGDSDSQSENKADKLKKEFKQFTKKRMMKYVELKAKNKTRSLPVDIKPNQSKKLVPIPHENYTITVKPTTDEKGTTLAENLVKSSTILNETGLMSDRPHRPKLLFKSLNSEQINDINS